MTMNLCSVELSNVSEYIQMADQHQEKNALFVIIQINDLIRKLDEHTLKFYVSKKEENDCTSKQPFNQFLHFRSTW